VGLSFTLVLKPTGIANFSTGEWAMLGTMLSVSFITDLALPFPLAVVAIIAFCGLVAFVAERVVIRPLIERNAPHWSPVLALLGLLIVCREAAGWYYGKDTFFVPSPFGFGRLAVGPVDVAAHSIFVVVVTAAVFAGCLIFFERTLWGKAFQAVAIDRFAAGLMGINLNRVTSLSFVMGGAVAGIAGLLEAPITSANYLLGLPLAIKGFSALVIGGVGRIEGALYGGLLLAFAEQATQRYAPLPSGIALGVPLLLTILFLFVRPNGLAAKRR
jgi:branched-chain amino acid transport system permease protein